MPQVIDRSRGKPTVFEFASAGAEILIDDVTGDMYVVTENSSVRRVGPQHGRAVLNGTPNDYTIYGVNISNDGASIPEPRLSSVAWILEQSFNDGSTVFAEGHLNIAAPNGSFKRPVFAAMALTGAQAGNITETALLADVVINFYGPLVKVSTAASLTSGAHFSLDWAGTGGKDWSLYSSGSGLALGAGHFILFNEDNSRYGIVCTALGSVLTGDLAAIATNATDGFLYVPSCAGAPTGTPTSYTGKIPLIVDSTNHKLRFYSGGAWRDAGP